MAVKIQITKNISQNGSEVSSYVTNCEHHMSKSSTQKAEKYSLFYTDFFSFEINLLE